MLVRKTRGFLCLSRIMKKLPYGISDYERIIEDNYYYVDKTNYIELLENLAEP